MSHRLFELEGLARLHAAELHRAAAQANLVRQPSPLAIFRRATARAFIAAGNAIEGHDPHCGRPARLPSPLSREILPVEPT